MNAKYFPVLRARQQEIDVLQKFDFGSQIIPIVEIIKEKDRKDNPESRYTIYSKLFNAVQSEKVIVDLPIYLTPKVSTSAEVRTFYLSTISNLHNRIAFYLEFERLRDKIIPVISILKPVSEETDTLIKQFEVLASIFPQLAFRIFYNNFDAAISELQLLELRPDDLIIYDLDTTNITNPIVSKHKKSMDLLYDHLYKIIIRSAINTDIQNVALDHEEVIGQADNSLRDLYKMPQWRFSAFGDYAGVKKDDITSGGGVSPGLVFYNPDENLYYGFRGPTKNLLEFEQTIIPAVLQMGFVNSWTEKNSAFIEGNPGYDRLINIRNGHEPSRSQAKYKWISIMHYLHCMKVLISQGAI
ncbi:hypothetical protein [Pedobacter sp. JY14-1]|uniref:beta family protein n=1 Tax=Pedobacter sp. JY14-1 TaxID=3034151 RepID=UPI0023E1BCDB|nr:hypothetical protein [Pedobacter sp. JY14-1]